MGSSKRLILRSENFKYCRMQALVACQEQVNSIQSVCDRRRTDCLISDLVIITIITLLLARTRHFDENCATLNNAIPQQLANSLNALKRAPYINHLHMAGMADINIIDNLCSGGVRSMLSGSRSSCRCTAFAIHHLAPRPVFQQLRVVAQGTTEILAAGISLKI
jgi:hypothetical protein